MIVGLIPCAGKAERLHGLPKYLLPLPDGYLLKNHQTRMLDAGIGIVGIALRPESIGMPHIVTGQILREMVVRRGLTMVDTLLECRWWAESDNVLMVMADTYFTPQPDLFNQMEKMLDSADVVLAVWQFQDTQRGKFGAVDLDGCDVREVVDKDPLSPHQFFWGAVAWKPTFWEYMKPEHAHLGIAINSAIAAGMRVRAVFADGSYFDCGTFEGYSELVMHLAKEGNRESA